jgi:NMD protein affecting ribosome stability and mRNA decay
VIIDWAREAFLQIAFCPWCGAQWKDNRWNKAEKAETKEEG